MGGFGIIKLFFIFLKIWKFIKFPLCQKIEKFGLKSQLKSNPNQVHANALVVIDVVHLITIFSLAAKKFRIKNSHAKSSIF